MSTTSTDSSTNKPVERISLGSVQLAIWKNTNSKGNVYYSVTPQTGYRDANGEWQPSSSYSRDDLLVLSQASQMAFRRIHELQAADREIAKQAQQQTVNVR